MRFRRRVRYIHDLFTPKLLILELKSMISLERLELMHWLSTIFCDDLAILLQEVFNDISHLGHEIINGCDVFPPFSSSISGFATRWPSYTSGAYGSFLKKQ